jgi:hypothetical protein
MGEGTTSGIELIGGDTGEPPHNSKVQTLTVKPANLERICRFRIKFALHHADHGYQTTGNDKEPDRPALDKLTQLCAKRPPPSQLHSATSIGARAEPTETSKG